MTAPHALRHPADAARTGAPEHDAAALVPAAERGAVHAFLRALFGYAPLRAGSALGLLVLQGATEGVGILLLVPFLILVGYHVLRAVIQARTVSQDVVADGVSIYFMLATMWAVKQLEHTVGLLSGSHELEN